MVLALGLTRRARDGWGRAGPRRAGRDGARPARRRRGHAPQREIPPGVWQTARLLGADPALVSCVVSPGFDFADFELAPSAS
ncbi:cupin domain-containing protein [Pseudonocardia benzenivorans]